MRSYMKNQLLLSVIVPAYNCEDTIENTIKSILAQNIQDMEILVINDGSKDKTSSIVCNLSKRDSRIKLFNNANHGVSYSRNFGIEVASGKYLTFVDSDDFLEKDVFSKAIDIFNTQKIELVIFSMKFLYQKNGNFIEKKWNENQFMNKKELLNNYELLYNFNMLSPCWNKIYITDLCKKIKFNESISTYEDYLFVTEYLKLINNLYILKDAYYIYNIFDKESLSKKYKKNIKNEIYALIDCLNNNHKVLGLDNLSFLSNQYMFYIYMIYLNSVRKEDAIKEIKSLNKENKIKEIISKYNVNLLFKYKVFVFLIKHKFNILLYIMLKLKTYN